MRLHENFESIAQLPVLLVKSESESNPLLRTQEKEFQKNQLLIQKPNFHSNQNTYSSIPFVTIEMGINAVKLPNIDLYPSDYWLCKDTMN